MAVQLRDAVLKEINLKGPNIRAIQGLPVEQLINLGTAVTRRLGALPGHARWGPWVDGTVLPNNPFDPAAPSISAGVPVLIGTAMNESSPIGVPETESLYQDVEKRASEWFGDKSRAIIEMARKLHPQAGSIEISTLIDPINVADIYNARLLAERKSDPGAAPAYMYLFGWHTPVLDGRPLAYHESEIPFVFDNTDRCASMTGGGAEPRALAARVSQAWVNFARSGNPNHPGLPGWPAFTSHSGATMVFDTTCQLQNYPDRPLHELVIAALSGQKHSP